MRNLHLIAYTFYVEVQDMFKVLWKTGHQGVVAPVDTKVRHS